MSIKEVEQITGLSRSSIRFYEKEKLISPSRNNKNGYREYSDEDIKNIKKIAYLRTLGISVEDIRKLSRKEVSLYDVVKMQKQTIEQQLSELENASVMCDRLLSSGENIDYENLDVEKYTSDTKDYLRKNKEVFKLDSVGFFYMWGGDITWGILPAVCLLTAVFSFGFLPFEIPVQWSSGGIVSSNVDRRFIFFFPVVCIIIKFLLRPFIWQWLRDNLIESDFITDYIVNYLCFIVLSVEIFIILYVNEIVKHVTFLFFAETFVFLGGLLIAIYNITGKRYHKKMT